jgi:hypothetical protein
VIEKAIPIFEALHPNSIALFQFDNSSNHGAFPTDALKKENMNLNPGGAQSKLRNGYYYRGRLKIVQAFNFPESYTGTLTNKQGMITPLAGCPKGMKVVRDRLN